MSVDRGSLTVKNITNELVDVAEWEPVGVYLGISAARLAEIRASRMNNAPLCKISMADTWLRGHVDASWEKLAQALDSSGNSDQAARVRENYADELECGGGATGYSGRAPGPSTGIQSKRPRVDNPQPPRQRQAQMAPPHMMAQGSGDMDLRKLFQAPLPEGGEGSRMEEVLHIIINNEIDVNGDQNGMSLLHEAIQKRDVVSLKTLIALGADVNRRNSFNMRALDVVRFSGDPNPDMIQIIKDVGGVSSQDNMPQPETGEGQMDTGDEQTMSNPAGNLVLCLDNSSTMALVQLELLHQIEKATGKKITELFQWIVASGIGGLLMLVMVYGQKSISELQRFYFNLYDRVFANHQATDKGKELEAVIIEELGDPATTGDCIYMDHVKEPKLLIGAVNKRTSTLDLKFFSNCPGTGGVNSHVWKVARYTCSSPLYFGEYDNYIDTGVLCKNMCGLAIDKIKSFYEGIQKDNPDPISMVVSLGDGRLPAQPLGPARPLSTYYLGSNPRLGNGKDLLSVFQNIVALYTSAASCQSEDVSASVCQQLCQARAINFIRFNPLLSLTESIPIPEEASIGTLINVIIGTIAHVATGEGKETLKEMLKDL